MTDPTGASPTPTPVGPHAALDDPATLKRRQFLGRLSLGLGALAAAVVSVPILGYLLSPLINRPANVWRDVGRLDQFKVGDTVEVTFEEPSALAWAGQTARTAAWLRRNAEADFTAYALYCTHLGCPVNWRPEAKLFLCPCHGGVYYADGSVAGGPPPHPLQRYDVRIQNGSVQILTRPLTFAQG